MVKPPTASTYPLHKIQVAAYTAGFHSPSARFRLRQFAMPLRISGIDVSEHIAPLGAFPPRNKLIRPVWAVASIASRLPSVAASWQADVTFLQREMLSTFLTLEPLTKRPRILDVDDAIYLHRGGHFARRIANRCHLVICGNAYLAEQFAKWAQQVVILPTAVDSDLLTPLDSGLEVRKPGVVIGWIGTSANHQYLRRLEPVFSQVLANNSAASLLIVSDLDPKLALDPARMEFRRWSENREVQDIQCMDVGVMPLADNPWARGKCSFKMLQYMACGLPVVVSPVGMNAEVLSRGNLGFAATTPTDWIDALTALIHDPALRKAMGLAGRRAVLDHYSIRTIAPQLGAAIRSVV